MTKAADDNYNAATATITVNVAKAQPVAVVFPTAGAITYGEALSASTLNGGEGTAALHGKTERLFRQ